MVDDDPPRVRRTGGRSARVRTSVLGVTIDVLSESGFDTLSIKEVAERAKVHESSIYRRWGTKADLAIDALLSVAQLEVPTPDTGSLREDLLALLRAIAGFLGTPLGENMVRMALRTDLPTRGVTSTGTIASRVHLPSSIELSIVVSCVLA
jgi:AcrR family transcriptional regulator